MANIPLPDCVLSVDAGRVQDSVILKRDVWGILGSALPSYPNASGANNVSVGVIPSVVYQTATEPIFIRAGRFLIAEVSEGKLVTSFGFCRGDASSQNGEDITIHLERGHILLRFLESALRIEAIGIDKDVYTGHRSKGQVLGGGGGLTMLEFRGNRISRLVGSMLVSSSLMHGIITAAYDRKTGGLSCDFGYLCPSNYSNIVEL